ncbi:MAG: OsmC family protein [Anaerolineae bacterium]|nr:OsmC family protein [Anaerolineae bacterium]MBT7073479.1 OsmC family protein [Anaerolineae bacterium]MBT7783770.1 OsmC family protein [Anaerolineae bacterium]
MSTNIKATWREGNAFLGENENGGKVEVGGENIRPMQMILVALAGCSGVDVVNILQKKRVNFSDLKIEVSGERADTHPKVYTNIHLRYLIWGEGIKEKDLEQAIRLSEDKYCSVSAMLKSTAKIQSDYKIFGEEND